MTGIERLREFVAGISPSTWVCGVTMTAYDMEHMEEARARLHDFLADIADQIERERDAEVADSPYDAILPEDRDALTWVREHGGLDAVKAEWRSRSNLKRMYEKEKAKVERQQRHIEFVQGKCRERQDHICELNKLKRAYIYALNGVCKRLGLTDGTGLPDMPEVIWAELDRRIMPEGMEWPKHTDGELVRIGGCWGEDGCDTSITYIERIIFAEDGVYLDNEYNEAFYRHGERVKRPAPKVLDADGAEIRVGDVLYRKSDGRMVEVAEVYEKTFIDADDYVRPGDGFTHRATVIASDGKPLEVGQTVWLADGSEWLVEELVEYGALCFDGDRRCTLDPSQLTHTKPEPKRLCRDCRQWLGDPSASHMGVCFNSYMERCCVDSYEARLDYAEACEDFEGRGE